MVMNVAILTVLASAAVAVAGLYGGEMPGWKMQMAHAAPLLISGLVVAFIDIATPFRKPLRYWPTRRADATPLGRLLLKGNGLSDRRRAVMLRMVDGYVILTFAMVAAFLANMAGILDFELRVIAYLSVAVSAPVFAFAGFMPRIIPLDLTCGVFSMRTACGVLGLVLLLFMPQFLLTALGLYMDDYQFNLPLTAVGVAATAGMGVGAWASWPFVEDMLQRIRCYERWHQSVPDGRQAI